MKSLIALVCLSSRLFGQIAFEVASIKPSAPEDIGHTSVHRHTDKGRLNYVNVSLTDMITDAYRVQPRQVTGPDWLTFTRFDINAKLPEGSDEKQIPEMLQSLLAERFGLKLREETKEQPIYALSVGKSGQKMKQIEKGEGLNSNGHNGRITIKASTTMKNFADNLSRSTDRPVIDQTGLDGVWEFELRYTADGVEATEPDAPPSLSAAVQEQLGLKLTPIKGPVRQLFVEHIDKTPAEN
jgi:uncharacterized protein (TIGR03435 family)